MSLDQKPSVRGMLKQIEKYRQNNEELESMIQNQIRMETDPQTQKALIGLHLQFQFEQILHLTLVMGLNHFHEVMKSHALGLAAMFNVLGAKEKEEEKESAVENTARN